MSDSSDFSLDSDESFDAAPAPKAETKKAEPKRTVSKPSKAKALVKAEAETEAVTVPAAPKKSAKAVEDEYQKLEQREHVLLRPDMYIGSAQKVEEEQWVYEHGLVYKRIAFVPGLYKIFDEILVNAADNYQRDKSQKTIRVEIKAAENIISVYNDGKGIPVEVHKVHAKYVPELIFGDLLAGSNFDDKEERVVGGRNGLGAKLANIFSTKFTVETADGLQSKKKFKQIFSENMTKRSAPRVSDARPTENWTKITFSPDLGRFGMDALEDDIVALMTKRVWDIAGCNTELKVYLNGQRLQLKNFGAYVKMYLEAAGMDVTPAKLPVEVVMDGKGLKRWEIAVVVSEGEARQVSFVNSICTTRGGTHVAHVSDKLIKHLQPIIEKKNKGVPIKPLFVRNNLWIFVNALINNPDFDSQTKETLKSKVSAFGSRLELSEDFLKKVAKAGIVEQVLRYAHFQGKMKLTKAGGGKKKRITGVHKLVDANYAGTKHSQECTLILTEGDSAKALAVAGMSVVGRDYYGVFPLRGKLLNVRDATQAAILKNEEIKAILHIVGLKPHAKYASLGELRYGHIMVMADQDHDGSHIKGLIINLMHHFWPDLLKHKGFLMEFITPIVKASKGTHVIPFYSQPEYDAWRERTDIKGWKVKYYKGLGTSTAEEAREYFSDLRRHKKDFVHTGPACDEAIVMAFGKDKAVKSAVKAEDDDEADADETFVTAADNRKHWIASHEPGTYLDQTLTEIPLSEFVNKELVLFSIENCQRAIPSMIDGLKPGQRKILFACFKRNLVREIKVAQLSGYVSENAAYHHGEASLQTTIVNMAQNFVGSNNINLLHPQGQFGTRLEGGKDAASARYITTFLTPLTRRIFPSADDPLLDYLEDDGQQVEPKWYIPVIPLVLCNGNKGIGTGWSSTIPNYNPCDLVANIRRLLHGESVVPMHPWYRGFHGTHEWDEAKQAYTVRGVWRRVDEITLEVTELPVGKWTQVYKTFLEKAMEAPKEGQTALVSDYKDYNTHTRVNFVITCPGLAHMSDADVEKKFALVGSIKKTNMHFFDHAERIKKYAQPEEILHEFFAVRIDYYAKRKAHLIAVLEHELLVLDNKVRFVGEVVAGTLVIANRAKKVLMDDLVHKGYDTHVPASRSSHAPAVVADSNDVNANEEGDEEVVRDDKELGYDYLLSMRLWSLTKEVIAKLQAQRDSKAQELEALKLETSASLWNKDLDAFEEAWIQFDEAMRLFDENETKGKKGKVPLVKAKARAKGKPKPKPKPAAKEESGMKRARTGDQAPPAKRLKTEAPTPNKAVPKSLITLSDSELSDADLKPLSVRLNEKRASLGSPPATPLKSALIELDLSDSKEKESKARNQRRPQKTLKAKMHEKAAARKTVMEFDDESGAMSLKDDAMDIDAPVKPTLAAERGRRRARVAVQYADASSDNGSDDSDEEED